MPKTHNQQIQQQSRQAILKAAGSCYLNKGFSQTTMDDIATQAQLGRATVFRHFKNKETLFINYVQQQCQIIIAKLAKTLTESTSAEMYIQRLFLFVLHQSQKEPLYKITMADPQSRLHSFDLSFFISEGDKLLEESFSPFYQQAKKAGKIRQGVSKVEMINWIKYLCISSLQTPLIAGNNKKQLEPYIDNFIIPSLLSR
jgi:AcrR family transcriptional regulator